MYPARNFRSGTSDDATRWHAYGQRGYASHAAVTKGTLDPAGVIARHKPVDERGFEQRRRAWRTAVGTGSPDLPTSALVRSRPRMALRRSGRVC
jgi:hypothetical protein